MSWTAAEDDRIARHLAGAERVLARRDVSALSPSVRRVRARIVEELSAYRLARRFPRNHTRPERTPVFVDPHGTRCAMAHLLELVGAEALVARVARDANLARIRDLVQDAELLRWLDAMGLTVAEAARIQPTYCAYPRSACWCGRSQQPVTAVVHATVLGTTDLGRTELRIDAVAGGSGVLAGEVREYLIETPPGLSVLLAIADDGQGNGYGFVVPVAYVDGGDCTKVTSEISIAEHDIVSSLLSPSCHDAMVAVDPRLAEHICPPLNGLPDVGVADATADDAEAATDARASGDAALVGSRASDGGCALAHVSSDGAALAFALTAATLLLRRRSVDRA